MIEKVEITLQNGKKVEIRKSIDNEKFVLVIGHCIILEGDTVAEVLNAAVKLYE